MTKHLGRLLVVGIAPASLGLACVAPAPRQDPGAFVPQPVVMPAQPSADEVEDEAKVTPTQADPSSESVATRSAVSSDAGPAREPLPPIPVSWSFTYGHTKPWAEAIRIARSGRAGFKAGSNAVAGSIDGGAPSPKDFEKANALLDLASREYAAAYHAPDSTPPTKIEALDEASAMILEWSRRLDEAGLARAPATYRSDPSVALTFEDVASGPAKRWREEGLALVQLCVESAKAQHIETKASQDCASLRQSYLRVLRSSPAIARATAARDGGSPSASGCACDPGDPLCSASMSGWCRPK